MSSNTIENSPPTNDVSSSPNSKLNKLYSTYDTHLSSRSSSTDSSCSSNKNRPEAQTSISSSNHHKESTIKLPYPVLSDHRDPSSVLPLLQNETQTTSKKILDVTQQIEDCEKRLTSNLVSDNQKKSLKYERVKRKQQLDALKKHERRVNLQIDYITTKTEIKGLEDEQQQMIDKKNSDENKQIEILSRKLKQKLDQMKIYMKKRNDEMKKTSNGKQQQSSISNDSRKQLSSNQKSQQALNSSDLNKKRSLSLTNNSHSSKHSKSTTHNHNKPPVVRLSTRLSSHQIKSHPIQTPTVRFLNKTTDSSTATLNSTSPTTPASSSSTLSPPLIASTSTGDVNYLPKSLQQNSIPSIDEDGELDAEFDMDELFSDDPYSQASVKRFKSGTRDFKLHQNISKTES